RRRAGARPRGHARRPRPGDPPPRQEQPPDGGVAAAAAGARRGGRPPRGARALGEPDPRDRGGARGADGAARGGRRAVGADRPATRRRHACRGGVPGVTRTQEVFVFVRRGDEFLVLHRSPENDAYWHGVAGGVEAGESFAAAAARELREETGLVAAPRPIDHT